MQIYPHTNTRRVPPSTDLTVKCSTSNCEHTHINVKEPAESGLGPELVDCDPINQNDMRTCYINITYPVELICVGVPYGDCKCQSSRSILIEIGEMQYYNCVILIFHVLQKIQQLMQSIQLKNCLTVPVPLQAMTIPVLILQY